MSSNPAVGSSSGSYWTAGFGALALDGKSVMAALAAGPGPHVGRALAHLAKFVEANPESNEAEALNRELDTWAKRHFPIVRPETSEKQPEKKVQ